MGPTDENDDVTAPKVDARVARTRSRLHAALLEMVQEMHIEDITIRSLVSRAGVSYPTFFRHYCDLNALLADITDSFLADLLSVTLPLMESDASRPAAIALTKFIDERRSLSRALLAGGAGGSIRQEFVRQALDTAERLPGNRFRDLPAGLGAYHAVNAIIGLLAWWLTTDESISPQKMGELVDRLIFAPSMRNGS